MILSGDIGGTKTRLAIFENGICIHEKKFSSKEYANFSQILQLFLSTYPNKIDKACFGVAGTIENGYCKTTNLSWVLEEKELSKQFDIPSVVLINDMEAHAFGIPCLKPDEMHTLHSGNGNAQGNAVFIGAGTGLGEAGMYWDGHTHRPFACEGGHADFAPQSELEMELLRYFKDFYGHVSWERVLSGTGLYHLYRFLVDMRLEEEEEFEDIATTEDPAIVIVKKALGHESRACERAVAWFVSLYGAESGNLALKMMATGGVYIGGGIAPKILPFMGAGGFMGAFTEKGRFTPFMRSIPVKIILNEATALLGATEYTKKLF